MKKRLIIFLIFFNSLNIFAQISISSQRIYNDIAFLSSDSLKGRYPGTKEINIAAAFLLNNYKQAGLKPMYNKGYQYFDMITSLKIVKTSMHIGKFSAKYIEQYRPLLFSPSGKIKANAVFAGYGMQIKKGNYQWNDYSNINPKGKWVVIFRGQPKVKGFPKAFFSMGSRDYDKVLQAQDNGAIGVIFVNDYESNPEDKLIKPCIHKVNMKSQIPAFSVKRTVANIIFKNTKRTVRDIENEIITKNKSVNFDLKTTISTNLKIKPVVVRTQNVVAYIQGSDPELKKQYIVIGAHYDHLGYGGCGSGSLMPDTIAIHNGADDNASGDAGTLELARYMAAHKKLLKRSIIFVNFSGEEEGLLGSKYFVKHPPVPKKQIYAMLNMDMIGQSDGKLDIMGTGTALEFDKLLKSIKNNSKNLKIDLSKSAFASSDHASFDVDSIPVLFFYASTAKHYHTPFDDIDGINAKGEAEVVSYIAKIIIKLANYNKNLIYTKIAPPSGAGHRYNMKVRLGIMPAYGTSEIVGLKIAQVMKGETAEAAGMKNGDIIKFINNKPVRNIYDYMARMSKINPGDSAIITIMRNGKKLNFNIKF
jgi:hypothetical protein